MGYVFDFKDAIAYEKWSDDPRNRLTAELEDRLLLNMLNPVRGRNCLMWDAVRDQDGSLFSKKGLI